MLSNSVVIDFDSWTNDRVISKPQDKTAIVKQGIKLCQKTRHYGLWARDMHVE